MKRIIIDVREQNEYVTGHIKGALNIPPAALLSGAPALAEVPKDTELILYCLTGSRSNVAKHILEQLGFTNVINGINKDQVKAHYGLELE